MWHLPLPPRADTDIDEQLDRGLIRVDGTHDYELSPAERQALHELYAAYDAHEGEPDTSLDPAALGASKQALHDAYGQVQKGGRLGEMRAVLLDVLECPLCGAAPATTLDHHLPRAQYKALAINPRNLVPSCQPCNRAKGTLVPIKGQGLIHAYFQALPANTFLKATASYENGALSFAFDIDSAIMPPPLYDRLKFQLQRLELEQRLEAPINVLLFTLKPAFELFRELPNEREQLLACLLAAARSYDRDFAPNHWRAAVVLALSNCDDFLDNPWLYLDRQLVADEAVPA